MIGIWDALLPACLPQNISGRRSERQKRVGGPAVELAFVKRVGNPLFRKDEEDAIKQFMKWLSHTSYKKIFFLLYGKADTLSEQQEIENCRTMCEHAIKMNLPLGFPPNAS